MSERRFTDSQKEILSFLFLTKIKGEKKARIADRPGSSIFSELENYLYNDLCGGYPIRHAPSELTQVIPKLGIDEEDASLFASYLGYCLLKRSDQDAIKMGLEPRYQMDLLCQFRKEIYAFEGKETEVVKRKVMEIAA